MHTPVTAKSPAVISQAREGAIVSQVSELRERVKLTKAQRDILSKLLASGRTIAFHPSTQSAWTSDRQGFTVKVRIATFNTLCLSGLIEKISETPQDEYYAITIAGRRALASDSNPNTGAEK